MADKQDELRFGNSKLFKVAAGGQVGYFRVEDITGVVIDPEYAQVILKDGRAINVGMCFSCDIDVEGEEDDDDDIDENEGFRRWFNRL